MITLPTPAGYRRKDAGYRRITLALFAAGMATFVAMYGAQAVLPALSDAFGVSPAGSALAVSATTGALALAIIPASALSERFGRVRVMTASALLSVVIGVVLPWVGSFELLIALRVVQGIALAGVPATAMAYLAEEVHAQDLGAAMGRYIAGTTIGGLTGRIVASLVLDISNWQWALEAAAVVSLGFILVFVRFAPPSVYFEPQPVGLRVTTAVVLEHLRNLRLLGLFATAFLLMGGFVSLYNLLAYRLLASPFNLSQTLVGLVFLMYLSGTVSAGAAGRLADRFGRASVLVWSESVALVGLLLTWSNALPVVLLGVLLFTAGFFAAHAVASGWVSHIAHTHRAEASSLYLLAYYAGSSVLGAVAGFAYSGAGWNGVIAYIGVAFALAILIAVALQRSR